MKEWWWLLFLKNKLLMKTSIEKPFHFGNYFSLLTLVLRYVQKIGRTYEENKFHQSENHSLGFHCQLKGRETKSNNRKKGFLLT